MNAGIPSRIRATIPQFFNPRMRRAFISQNTVSTPIAAMKNSEFHFTATAAPAQIPAARRHRCKPEPGPKTTFCKPDSPCASTIFITFAASLLRAVCRSRSRQTKVAKIQNIWKISRSARRDSTNIKPSTAPSSAAIEATVTERNMSHPATAKSATASVPIIAALTRQPKAFSPKIAIPQAIIHLPRGGCTTYSGLFGKIPLKSPEANA